MLTELLAQQSLLEGPFVGDLGEFATMDAIYKGLGGRLFLFSQIQGTLNRGSDLYVSAWDRVVFENLEQLKKNSELKLPWQTYLVTSGQSKSVNLRDQSPSADTFLGSETAQIITDCDFPELKFDCVETLQFVTGPKSPALFLDRDGVVIQDKNYLIDPMQIDVRTDLFPIVDAARKQGYKIILVTNQSGLGRRYFDLKQYQNFHLEMQSRLPFELDAHYFSPYWSDSKLVIGHLAPSLRKPLPGMLFWAAIEHSIDLGNSWLIGDSPTDIEAATAAGLGSAFLWNTPSIRTPQATPAKFLWSEKIQGLSAHF